MGRKGVMVAAGLLAVATPLGAWAAASAPDAGCQVAYKVATQWPGGFIGNVTVTNAASAVNGCPVGFGFPRHSGCSPAGTPRTASPAPR
jgi:hypothetical protein